MIPIGLPWQVSRHSGSRCLCTTGDVNGSVSEKVYAWPHLMDPVTVLPTATTLS